MDEFLKQLRRELSMELNQEEVQKHVDYYYNYFQVEKKNGKSEQETLQTLGNPKWIAKSILNASDAFARGAYEASTQRTDSNTNASKGNIKTVSKTKIIMILVIIGVIVLAGVFLVMTALWTIFRLLLPILVPLIVLVVAFAVIRNIINKQK